MSLVIYYAYLDIRDPFVAWEVAIGRLCSADNLENEGLFSLSTRQFSFFRRYSRAGIVTPQIKNENRLEKIRFERYCKLPSRLRGVFVFDNKADAESAAIRWDVSHFDSRYLAEIEMIPDRKVRLDSEWITSNLLADREDVWMDRYWRGEVYGERPLTEVICSGVGRVLNTDLRKRAYESIMAMFPRAVPLLSMACIAYNLGFNRAAQIVPYLIREGEMVKGVHVLNMNDFNEGSQFFNAFTQYNGPRPPLAIPWDGVILRPDLSANWFYLSDADLFQLVGESPPTSPTSQPSLERLRQAHDTKTNIDP